MRAPQEFNCLLWNARSLNKKLHHLTTLLLEEDLDMVFITETWFKSQQNNCTSTLRENGYSIFHFNRTDRGGGGVAFIYKDCLKLSGGKCYNYDTSECIVGSMTCITSKKITFVLVYRFTELAPSLFLTEFYTFIEKVFVQFNNLIILGDFNLHVNQVFNPEVIKFNSILSSFGLSQLVDQQTHVAGNTLDLVIANQTEMQIKDINVDHVNFSDHSFVFFKFPFDYKKSERKTVSMKIYKDINLDDLKMKMTSKVKEFTEKEFDNFADALNNYNLLCNDAIKENVIIKTVNIGKVRPKWIDLEYQQSRAERRRLYKRWVRTRSDEDRYNFVNCREKTHELSIKKQSQFYSETIKKSSNSQKSLFSICKNLLDVTKVRLLPSYTCPVYLKFI